jgi:predicted NUDIX family NTP pyrophosphohydrolase
MAKHSAGILLYRQTKAGYEVLLVHPGGPFWAKKDAGVWSIPKGEFGEDEEPLAAAKRELAEELGHHMPKGELVPLGEAKQPSGKVVHIWALEADMDTAKITSNTLTIDWPPRSGKKLEIPEVDRAGWFSLHEATVKLLPGQLPFLDRVAKHLGTRLEPAESNQASLF